MKKIVYTYFVGEFQFIDNKPWGIAWQQAQEKAKELHTTIHRRVLNIYQSDEVYVSGMFLGEEDADGNRITIF